MESHKTEPTTTSKDESVALSPAIPEWLKTLETQSWQAELLISGLIIAGLFQTPDLFIQWLGGHIVESNELGFLFLTTAGFMILAGINSLIVFFGFHFLFRGIWVALLGLNSVYPDGIDINSKAGAGEKYWRKAKEKYPNLSAYNLELDKQCSVIFSLATVTIIMVFSLSIIILLAYQVFRLLISISPGFSDYVIPIAVTIYLLYITVSFSLQWLAKKYPDNERIERYILRYSDTLSGIFSLYVFKKPIGYITSIYMSNVKSKYMIFVMALIGFFLGLSSAFQTRSNPVFSYFSASRYITFNNRPHLIQPYNYDNLRPPDLRIFTPVIPSDKIEDNVLKVFIPTIDREKEKMELTELSFWQKLKTDRNTRDSLAREKLRLYANFNRIFVNDIEYPDLEFQYYTHPNAEEEGVLTYIPTDHFREGKNILEIRKDYFSKKGKQKIVAIPFYFEHPE